jgi:hypothetical protein
MNRYQEQIITTSRKRKKPTVPQQDPFRRIRAFQPYFDLSIGVDLLVFGEEETARRLADGDAFMAHIWQESRPLGE